jgi:hypothetical protein
VPEGDSREAGIIIAKVNGLSHGKILRREVYGLKRVDKRWWQEEFDDALWKHIENFLKNLRNLPLWVDREKDSHIFS